MSKEFKTRINGFEVELEVEIDSDPSTQCFVSKGRYSGSLSLLQGAGVLSASDDSELDVPESIVEKISAWAEKNGY